MGKLLLETTGLSKRFCRRPELALRYASADMWREMTGRPPRDDLRKGEFWALQDVDICLEAGEVLGVIGHNGAGKSTLINLIAGLILPTKGKITLHTDRVALMDANGGLNMAETGLENIATQLALHGCPTNRIQQDMEAVIAFAGLGDFIEAAVATYSLGMRLRLAFSIYTRLKPDLFIVDEALSGGDLRFRQKFQNYLREYIEEGGSILLCSHDLFIMQMLCRRCVLMDSGRVLMMGPVDHVIARYQSLMAEEASQNAKSTSAAIEIAADALLEDEDEPESDVAAAAVVGGASHPPDAAGAPDAASPLADLPVIESVSICAPDGRDVVPGGPLEIEIVCQSPGAFSSVLWGIEIGRAEHFPMAGIGTGLERNQALLPGRNILRCRIDSFPFLPGKYEFRFSIVNKSTGILLTGRGYEDNPVCLEIPSVSDASINLMLYRKNMVYISARWE